MTIVEYIDARNIIVKFDGSGFLKKTNSSSFKKGSVKSPYCKSVSHMGYIGEGKYVPKVNGKATKQYVSWQSMLERCYSPTFQKKRPTYIGCTVCEEWLNFQTFGKWYDENYYEVESNSQRGMNLDKDILNKNNRIYCPEFCLFAPDRINLLFIKVDKSRGDLPVGVKREGKKYIAYCSRGHEGEQSGKFPTIEEAFNAYKNFKETYIKQVADEYKNIIPERLYDALYKYEVSIDD